MQITVCAIPRAHTCDYLGSEWTKRSVANATGEIRWYLVPVQLNISCTQLLYIIWYPLQKTARKTLPWQLLFPYGLSEFTHVLACLSLHACVARKPVIIITYKCLCGKNFRVKYFRRTSTLQLKIFQHKNVSYNKNFPIYGSCVS